MARASSTRCFRTAVAGSLLAGVILLLALVAGGPGASASCGLRASVTKRVVARGETLGLRGAVCSRRAAAVRRVDVKLRDEGGWRPAKRVRVRRHGRFRSRLRVGASWDDVTVLRISARGDAKTLRLRVHGKGCPLSNPASQIGLGVSGCRLVASDTADVLKPTGFWGRVDCQTASQSQQLIAGGDPHLTALGAAQGDGAYRRQTVFDGDDVYGERCELGLNDHRTGPTVFYREGQRRATLLSVRLPANLPLATGDWQTVMQMKQTQPSDGGGGGPILEMNARSNQWQIINDWKRVWTFPAQSGVWTRFVWDVTYSQDPGKGALQVSADLDGDGDLDDPGERSPRLRVATLKTEVSGPKGTSDGLAAGDPIPSHLRAGIYHHPAISCPAPAGCSTDIDNVQVLAP
jgi:hypothetical protein